MSGLDNRIANIIGAPIPQWVIRQLTTRSTRNIVDFKNGRATVQRSNTELVYLENKTGWVRLVSSIDVTNQDDLDYFKTQLGSAGISIENGSSLAEKFVLYGGTSAYKKVGNQVEYSLRSGLGNNGAYGMLGKEEIQKYGYKPMPGITNVKIETQGKLGSLRAATINFKVWDKMQLDIIEVLYFKLGYSMFLEWGNTFYYKSYDGVGANAYDLNKLYSSEDNIIDPFNKSLDKDEIRYQISKSTRAAEGNYDAMLGIVTNFTFSFTADGGYDCTLNLQSLGILGDSIRINSVSELGEIVADEAKKLTSVIVSLRKYEEERQRADQQKAEEQAKTNPSDVQNYPECVRDGKLSKRDLKTNPKAFYEWGIFKEVNKVGYIFYIDGRWQTTGLSLSGSYSCVEGVLFIDGKSTDEEFYTYAEVIEANKNNLVPLRTSFGNPYYLIDNKKGYDYFAIDKLKGLLPIDSNKKIDATLNIAAIEKLPSFTDTGNSAVDLLLNALTKTKDNSDGFLGIGAKKFIPTNIKTKAPVSSDLVNEYGIRYNVKQNLQEGTIAGIQGNDDYDVEIEYPGRPLYPKGKRNERRIYSIKLQYGAWANADVEGKSVNISSIDQDVQDAIKTTVISNETKWTITSVENEKYTSQYADNIFNGVFEAETIIEITKKFPVNRQLTAGTTNNSRTKVEYVDAKYYLKLKLIFSDLEILTSFSISDNSGLVVPLDQVALINKEAAQQKETPVQVEEVVPLEAPQQPDLDPNTVATEQAKKYRSALEIMLRAMQLKTYNEAAQKKYNIGNLIRPESFEINEGNKKFFRDLYSKGIFSPHLDQIFGKINPSTQEQYDTAGSIDRLKYNMYYGFHSGLMSNKQQLDKEFREKYIVDYNSLLTRYILPYRQSQNLIEGSTLNHPVYITLGHFLMLLNHCCTLYSGGNESTKEQQFPLVYIDFNPESNLCLSTDKMLTTDPYRFMIPFEGTTATYRSIFPEKINKKDFWDPDNGNPISKVIKERNPFRLPKKVDNGRSNAYRGKIMNALVSIDYLLQIVDTHSTQDETNTVYLKSMLEEIVSDLNKSLGNFNIFRLGFNDQADTFFISDDQVIPSDNMVLPTDNKNRIPLYGLNSIAQSVEIKTEISNKLANILAISANSDAENQATSGKNGSDFGAYNLHYKDRYKPTTTGINDTKVKDKEQKTATTNTEQETAKQFDEAIRNFYQMASNSEGFVSQATNYYIERMAKVKNEDPGARASAMIPVSLNFSTDGISGLNMGQAFTIDEELLPYNYRKNRNILGKKDHINTVGFVVVGLDHDISNNRWISNVRANMIYLKDRNDYTGSIKDITSTTGLIVVPDYDVHGFGNVQQTNYVAAAPEAKLAAEKYLGRPMTDTEWNELVSATFAEASGNQTERGYVMGVILNRVRSRKWGDSVSSVLRARNQFQAVTGTSKDPGPSDGFVSGPGQSSANSIYGAATTILPQVPTNYMYFTAALLSAYGPGTNPGFIQDLLNRGGKRIGDTIFSA
jgi:hypothetical protein